MKYEWKLSETVSIILESMEKFVCGIEVYRKLVPFEALTNSFCPGSSKQSKLMVKYSELLI